MIKCLPQEVQEKLRSGVAIFSLQQCIEELVVNSIDAAATCVGVRLDMEAYKVQVIDNGTGMALEDMQHVGNRYFTSKCSSIEDLDNLRFYGYRGEAVASLVSLAMLVEISSRTKLSMKTRVKVFKDGKGLDVYECETSRPSAGTTVVICNFFHNMPVRRKRMDAVLECERIRHRVEAISLMHPSVSFTLKNDCTGAMVVQLSKARNTYYRFVQIHGLGRAQKLREIHHTHGQFEVGGYIGREGHYNNSLQYLYVNDRLLLKTRIHKLMNLLLRKVSVSNVRNDSPEAPSTVRSPKQRRGGELHGTYVINVKCPYSEYDVCLEPAKTLVEFKDWEGVLFCIEEAVKSFLTRENLVSELYPEDLEDASPRLFSAAGRGRPEDSPCQEAPRALGVAIPECTIGKTLASESVHRRPSGASAPKQITQSTVEYMDYDSNEPMREKSNVSQGNEQVSLSTSIQCVSSSLISDLAPDSASFTQRSDPVSKTNSALEVSHGCNEPLLGVVNISVGSQPPRTEERSNDVSTDSVFAVSLPRSSVRIPTVAAIDRPGLPPPTGLNSEQRRKICLSDPFIHEGLWSHQSRQTLFQCKQAPSWKGQESSYSTKRKLCGLETSNHVRADQKQCSDLSTGVPAKIPKVTSCQRLSLTRETGSLDKFRRMYGKPTVLKPPWIDRNSNVAPSCAGASVMEDLVMTNDLRREAELDKDVTVPQQEVQCDFKRPLALPVFTRLKPWNSGTSLAAKLSLLQQRRGEVHTATLMEPSGPPSNEERPDLNHNQEGPSDTHSEPPSKEERPDLNHNQEGPSDTHSEPPSNEERPDLNHNQEGPSDTHSEPPSNEERPDLNHNQEGPRDTHSEPPSNEDRPDLNHNQEGPSDTHSEPPSNEERPDTGPTERCEAGAPGDWVSLYDDVVGKMVYVNRMTGLSRYQQPTVEDTHACCTSDLTNMAVSVISKAGMEYRCYPFPMDLVLPFLPKPRAERGLSSGPVHPGDTETSNSLSSVFCEWTNPVFVRPPKVGVDVSSGQAEGLAVKIHNILFPYRFSKDMIHSMKVIHQVDKKFLACLINTRNPEVAVDSSVEGNLLVLVDQHAAHERVRLESLVADAYEEDPEAPGERRLRWSTLSPPLEVELGEEETRLLRSCQTFLRGLGLKLQFTSLPAEEPKVLVAKVPVCFTEKEGSELRRGRQSVIKPIVQEYLREQIEVLRFTGRVRGTLPLTILKVLASIACHGAIKFNDSLSREECCSLVGCLSVCQLPFQCAHGRPSIAPLVDFLHLESCPQEPQKPNLQKLRRLQRAWELYGNR